MPLGPQFSTGVTAIIDSNVFIALESAGHGNDAHSHAASRFVSLCSKVGVRLVIASATQDDLTRAPQEIRVVRERQIQKYFVLAKLPNSLASDIRKVFPSQLSPNDEADLQILAALNSGAADWLVSQDQRLLRRARNAGLGDSTFSLTEVIDVLESTLSRPSTLTTIQMAAGYQIDLRARIFDDLRSDYPEFDEWWKSKVAKEHRDIILLGEPSDPEGLAVLKIEVDRPHALGPRVLKLSTFVTSESFQGTKRGELLLRAALEYARNNDCSEVYVEALPSKEFLVGWLGQFGFVQLASSTARNELVLSKRVLPKPADQISDPLAFNVAYGPGAILVNSGFLVPIQRRYHTILFPDAEEQISFLPRQDASGNAIRKMYLSNSNNRQIRSGDALLFYRSGRNAAITAIGVAEETRVSMNPEEIIAFAGSRTVYTSDEVAKLCQRGEVLAIRFRHDRVISPPWTREELRSAGVLKASPQSIQGIPEGAIQWIRSKTNA